MPVPALRILRGGITAGVIRVVLNRIDLALFQGTYETLAGRPDPSGPAFLAVTGAINLVAGVAAVSLYSARLPGRTPGPRLAARAAVLTWVFLSMVWSISALADIVPWSLFVMRALVALPIAIVSTLAGARAYGWDVETSAPRARIVDAQVRADGART